MSSQVFDSWADDGREVDPGELPQRLATLRDNEQPEQPAQGKARQRRLDKMQKDLNECGDVIADFDRYIDYMKDAPCVGRIVPHLMTVSVNKKRQKAVDYGKQLHAELQYIRAQTQ